ncbi:MAG: hypothetical protein ABIG96_02905 [Candidatus Micrarchaeota archaeon]
MNLTDYLRATFFPYLILLVLDVFDYVGTIYFAYRKTIPQVYIDIVFLFASLPVYIYVIYKVVAREGGDREDATVATFLLAFTKWAMTWLITFAAFHFVFGEGANMPVTAFTTFENPYMKFFSLGTIEQFAYHVIGAVAGGFALGMIFEEFMGRKDSKEVDIYQTHDNGGFDEDGPAEEI